MARRPGGAVAVVLGMAGLLFVASAGTARGTDLRNEIGDLRPLIVGERDKLDATEQRNQDLADEIDTLAAQSAAGGPAEAAVAEADALKDEVGLTPVTGRAVVVTLDDAPDDAAVRARAESLDDLLVHQQDVEAVMNSLWSGGATAMMVMDQRIIMTSAPRCVGNTLSLQGRPYSPPYTITAIGDVDSMLAELDRSPEIQIYRQYVEAYGLGYDVSPRDDVEVPAYPTDPQLEFARVDRT